MKTLSPRLASVIADSVYGVIDATPEKPSLFEVHTYVKDYFDFPGNHIVQGTSGGWILRITSGFVLVGVGKGEFAGSRLIAIRGSASLADAATDAHIGVTTSTSGNAVHSGFQQTFESFRQTLQPYVERAPAGTVFHCVGHSLGGALASLAADWIKHSFGRTTCLYTFGAPRVGLENFATATTHRLDGIYRCTHGADPAPVVPLWPFTQAPVGGLEYRLDTGTGISFSAHLMSEDAVPGYLNTANYSSWDVLAHRARVHFYATTRLRYQDRHQASFTTEWAERLGEALVTLLKDAGCYGAVMGQQALMTGFTFYDLLARTLEQIAQASVTLGEQVRGLLGHMLVFAGRVLEAVVDLTFSFIRWVFEVTIDRLYGEARQAMAAVH